MPVAVQAWHDKGKHTEPKLVRALVAVRAERPGEVITPFLQGEATRVPGYSTRIVDGSHLPASEKRLKPLRTFRGAALPRQSLVVYDPDSGVAPCEDAHSQERAVMSPFPARAQPPEDSGIELSPFYVALEERAHYASMVMAVPTKAWRRFDAMCASNPSEILLQIAAYAKPETLRKHPRGPKVARKRGYVAGAVMSRHVSTANVLKDGEVNSHL